MLPMLPPTVTGIPTNGHGHANGDGHSHGGSAVASSHHE
jgi:hypothetical protein